jgi:hypothetical protein
MMVCWAWLSAALTQVRFQVPLSFANEANKFNSETSASEHVFRHGEAESQLPGLHC